MQKGRVTKEYIKEARKEECSRCPMELALQDIFKKKFTVGLWSAYHWGDGSKKDPTINYRLTQDISKWISSFDNNEDVKPFNFEIDEKYITMTAEI